MATTGPSKALTCCDLTDKRKVSNVAQTQERPTYTAAEPYQPNELAAAQGRRRARNISTPVVAAGAVVLVLAALLGAKAVFGRGPARVTVVAAKGDVPAGTVLSVGHLSSIELVGKTPRNAIINEASAVGKTTRLDLGAGDPILASGLLEVPTAHDGEPAFSLSLPRANVVDADVRPGDTVDIFVADTTGQQQKIGMWVAQSVPIISRAYEVATAEDGTRSQMATLVLQGPPEVAQWAYVALAQGGADHVFAVRSSGLGPGHVTLFEPTQFTASTDR